MAADAVGLLDALRIPKAHIVGASMGAMIAQTVAIKYPERVCSLTSIMSTTGARGVGAATAQAQAALQAPPAASREEAVQRALAVFRVIGSPGYPLDESALADTVCRSYDRANDPLGVARQIVESSHPATGPRACAGCGCPRWSYTAKAPARRARRRQGNGGGYTRRRAAAISGMGHDLPRALWRTIIDAITRLARGAP